MAAIKNTMDRKFELLYLLKAKFMINLDPQQLLLIFRYGYLHKEVILIRNQIDHQHCFPVKHISNLKFYQLRYSNKNNKHILSKQPLVFFEYICQELALQRDYSCFGLNIVPLDCILPTILANKFLIEILNKNIIS